MALAGLSGIAEWRLKPGARLLHDDARTSTIGRRRNSWRWGDPVRRDRKHLRASHSGAGGLEKVNDLQAFRIAAKGCTEIDCQDDRMSLLFIKRKRRTNPAASG
jgi:hypothetical protein